MTIHETMTYDEYTELPGLRHSTLKRIEVSPLNLRRHVQEETSSMALGSAVHCAVLEPDRFDDEFVMWGGTRRGKAWDAFADEHSDKTILTAREMDQVERIMAAVRGNEEAVRLIDAGRTEVSYTWEDGRHRLIEGGDTVSLQRKARADIVTPQKDPKYNVLADLKTARDVTPDGFAKACASMLYHAQMADYADGLARNGVLVSQAMIIAVQNCEPYDCVVYDVTDLLARGRYIVNEWLTRYCDAYNSRQWHGIQGGYGAIRLELPPWADGPIMRSNGEVVEVE